MECLPLKQKELAIGSLRVGVFGVEHTVEALEAYAEALGSPDVVLVELPGYDKSVRREIMETINGITEGTVGDGELSELLKGSDDYLLHLSAKLRRSKPLILLIDAADDGSPLAHSFKTLQQKEQYFIKSDVTHPSVATIAAYAELETLAADVDEQREQLMAHQITEHAHKLEADFTGAEIAVIVGAQHYYRISQLLTP